jgi:hypothetical protein
MAGSTLATARGARRTALLAFAGAQVGVYTVWMLAHDGYHFVVINTSVAMGVLLLLHGWSAAARRDEASYWALAGIAVSATAAAMQLNRVTLHEYFNYNDLYHVIQIAGIALFFKGGKLLRDRDIPEAT